MKEVIAYYLQHQNEIETKSYQIQYQIEYEIKDLILFAKEEDILENTKNLILNLSIMRKIYQIYQNEYKLLLEKLLQSH